ncbi:MAG: hypothetical protein Q8R22_11710 [Flavobacterium sp.]|jgi:hypothetical protein|uniref:hypothetical protein n=1 Tax=Flavobacterium sp. TaxID=239 RepID=UPI0027372649|nr:hypothetical protein [Flavobacterium sp.]MDP3681487.1 hypothetical protein [Flavobacterium sp.]MDZ4331768.1 hypothetical protein [Flavobacterium sp.]
MEKIENWRKKWFASINELTSLELQQKSWLNKQNTNPHWSFIEFTECYFDDLFVNDNYTHALNEGLINQQEYDVIKAWHEMLSEYVSPNEDDYNHNSILNDPNWIEVIELGLKMKKNLSEIINSEERLILEEKINVA